MKFLATKDEFDSVLASAGDNLVVVDFTASWCKPCKLISPQYEVRVFVTLGFSEILEALKNTFFLHLSLYE